MKLRIPHALAGAFLALVFSLSAHALSLDEAKQQGLVGERATGYLGIVTGAPSPDLKRMVDEINQKRRNLYLDSASKAGVAIDIMEMRTGQRLQERAPAGEYIQDQNGQWQRK